MGWDRGRYYTRSKKVNGRVVREYIGTGRAGELAAERDAAEREQRRLDALALGDKIAELDGLAADLQALNEMADLLARAALLAAGFRRHKRGEWRKQRMSKQTNAPRQSTPAVTPQAEKALTEAEELALARRAEKGDQTALATLRPQFRDPAVVDRLGGDLARQSQLMLIEKLTKGNPLMRETLQRKAQILRGELFGPSPTPLEQLLAERVVSTWLHLHYLETIYAIQESISLAWGTYYQRSITLAQKRYLAAIKTLAVVRKVALPVLQVNIADKQVNVAAPALTADRQP
jgi:hypothetical protein